MKLKVSQLVTAVAVLRNLDMAQMKLSTSYKVRKILNECQTAITDFETQRTTLAEEHGTLSEDKTHYEFETDEARQAFSDGLQAILDDEMELKVEPIPLELIDDHITITPGEVDNITWLVSGLE